MVKTGSGFPEGQSRERRKTVGFAVGDTETEKNEKGESLKR
jgi:hypothetical protein